MRIRLPHRGFLLDLDGTVYRGDALLPGARTAIVALQAVRRHGARLIGTNADRTCPVDGGEVPDAAGMIAAVEAVTGRRVDPVVGKPSPIMLAVALDRLGLPPAACAVVGDRLETD